MLSNILLDADTEVVTLDEVVNIKINLFATLPTECILLICNLASKTNLCALMIADKTLWGIINNNKHTHFIWHNQCNKHFSSYNRAGNFSLLDLSVFNDLKSLIHSKYLFTQDEIIAFTLVKDNDFNTLRKLNDSRQQKKMQKINFNFKLMKKKDGGKQTI